MPPMIPAVMVPHTGTTLPPEPAIIIPKPAPAKESPTPASASLARPSFFAFSAAVVACIA
ncbi:hypothetical protein Lche_1196 [Legionella cherrii]|uniref:Uncharacterized protein n=1 Tax=Legionella cherrii TaxID=28084 RepID=A0A0W0S6R4_9GAMM|nr:hypothetical protein Lche_1196 [Legionella cherrii]